MKLTDAQIATLNGWLTDAYEAGRNAVQQDKPPVQTPADGELYPVYNIIPDLSQYQTDVDIDALCAGSDFVILRARVCTKTDSKFEERAAELVKRKMPFCVYDYATLMSNNNARQQAEAVYALCEPYGPSVYYIDTEQLGTGVKRGDEYGYIETYVKRLRELGAKKVGQYTGDWLYSTYYKRIQDLFDTIWIASYGTNTGQDTGVELESLKYTDKVDLHEYTDRGVIPGVPSLGDLSHLTGHRPLSWFTGRQYA